MRRPIHRSRTLIVFILFLTAAGAAAWAFHDPLPGIRDELRAAAADGSNHAPYAELVRAELAAADRLKETTFEMPCFWSGESHFGGLAGVYRTTPGTQNGKEVVRVEYDPLATTSADLLAAPDDSTPANRACPYDPAQTAASRLDPTFHPDDQPKWSIQQTNGVKYIPMTPAQAARVNAYLHAGRPIEPLLCPAQNALLTRVRNVPAGPWTVFVSDERLWNSLRQPSAATTRAERSPGGAQ